MGCLEDLIARAMADPKHIVLSEGTDSRVIEAAVRVAEDGIADITLLGPHDPVRELIETSGQSAQKISIVDPETSPDLDRYVNLFRELPRNKRVDEVEAKKRVQGSLAFGNLMVRAGDADGSIGGAVHNSADVVNSAARIIGRDPKYAIISSCFLMVMEEDFHPRKGAVFFADCALSVEPNAHKLAHIAAATADSAENLLGMEPKLALLSFSTRGSAQHASIDKMAEAGEKLKAIRPDLAVESAVQFDTAFVPEIAATKAPDSAIAGEANVLIFPDLNSGNIAYKIAERIGRVKAVGPILQGLSHPANDLSRGCDADAVYNMIVLTVIQAQQIEKSRRP